MKTKEMIEILRYKADNIRTKIEPEFFREVAKRLRALEEYKKKFEDDVYKQADMLEKQITKEPTNYDVDKLIEKLDYLKDLKRIEEFTELKKVLLGEYVYLKVKNDIIQHFEDRRIK